MFVDEILKNYSKYGLSEVEVYSIKSRGIRITVGGDKIREVISTDQTILYNIRGARNKKLGSLTIRGGQPSIDEVFNKLGNIISITPEDPDWPGFPTSLGLNSNVVCYDKRVIDTLENKEALLEEFVNIMTEVKEQVKKQGAIDATITEAAWSLNVVEYTVANSTGLFNRDPCTLSALYLVVKAETPKGTSDGDIGLINRRFDLDELHKIIQEDSSKIVLFAGSKPVESGKYSVILDSSVVASILSSVLIPAFSALNIMRKRSPLEGKIGVQVFTDQLTLIDDPTVTLEVGSRSIDDEGIATATKILVDKGIVKNILHNYYTYRKMSTGIPGNGFRSPPNMVSMPAPTNIVVKPISGNIEEFTRDVRRGIIVYDVIGQWLSNPVTGYVKATITHGLLVENGEIKQPVKGMVMVGNIYNWLREQLQYIGSDSRAHGGIITPSMVIREVEVGGT